MSKWFKLFLSVWVLCFSHQALAVFQQHFDLAQHTIWFLEGDPNAPHKTYVVANLNCEDDMAFNQRLRPFINAKKLAVRWVLVNTQCSSDKHANAMVLQHDNPAQIVHNFTNKLTMPQDFEAEPETLMELRANHLYLEKLNIVRTPVLVFMDKNQIHHVNGDPTDPKKLANMITKMTRMNHFTHTSYFAERISPCATPMELHHPGDAHRRGFSCQMMQVIEQSKG